MTIASHSKDQHGNSSENARLAQLEERGHHKAEAIGSNPIPRICSIPLTQNKHTTGISCFYNEKRSVNNFCLYAHINFAGVQK